MLRKIGYLLIAVFCFLMTACVIADDGVYIDTGNPPPPPGYYRPYPPAPPPYRPAPPPPPRYHHGPYYR